MNHQRRPQLNRGASFSLIVTKHPSDQWRVVGNQQSNLQARSDERYVEHTAVPNMSDSIICSCHSRTDLAPTRTIISDARYLRIFITSIATNPLMMSQKSFSVAYRRSVPYAASRGLTRDRSIEDTQV